MKRLTKQEKEAIKALKEVAKIWPDSLWLFSASGNLCVMKKDENNERVMHYRSGPNQDWKVDQIDIENDGGDF